MSSTLAGNLTILGSIANLIVVEGARRRGVSDRFRGLRGDRRAADADHARVRRLVAVAAAILTACVLRQRC